MDILIGILAVGLPLTFVFLLIWAESGFKWGGVFLYLSYGVILVLLGLVSAIWHPFANIKDWQMGVFGVVFALALVGIHHLVERGKNQK